MRTSLMISVINVKDEELGLDNEKEYYARFFFNSEDFHGYWVVDGDDGPSEICFYVGAQKFFCNYNEKNMTIIEKIMDSNDTTK